MDIQKINLNLLKNEKLLLFIFLFIFFILSFFPLRTSYWWDETVYLQHAEVMFSGRTNYDQFSFRPPLLSIIFFLGFFIKHSVITASILTVLINTIGIIFIYLIGEKLYDKRIGIIAALIYATVPFIIKNSNYLLTDVPAVTFLAIAFYFSLSKDKNFLLFLSGLFCSLAVLMKFTTVLFFPVLIFYFLINRINLKKMLLFVFGASIVLLPYFIWVHINYNNFLTPFIIGKQMVSDTNESLFFYFINMSEVFTKLVILGVIFWAIIFLIKIRKKNFSKINSDLVMLVWIFIFLIYLTKTPHKELRYILPIAIPIILIASEGLSLCFSYLKKNYQLILWFVFIIYLIFLIYPRVLYIQEIGFVDRTVSDEMIIADYLHDINYSGLIYTNTRCPVLAYYTNLKIQMLIPWDQNFYLEYENIMKEKGILIGMLNEKYPQPDWLNKNPKFKHLEDIGIFFIYEYSP
jgi:4-amino-4-deoxy-L-arabinose transferase-like glycosyltransferase